MKPKRRRGWLFSLAYHEGSPAGDVDAFYDAIDSSRVGRDGFIKIEWQCWGRIRGAEAPSAEDGFAFYHSSRARFPRPDQHRRVPRISLIGTLLDVRSSGRDLDWIRVAVEPGVLVALRRHPILRDAATKPIFERAGLVPGAVF